MSLRGRITGEVIRRLNAVAAEDPQARFSVYSELRLELTEKGFEGASAEEALQHLESAIRFQEVYWLRETGRSLAPDPDVLPAAPTEPEDPQHISWRWPGRLRDPGKPPGPRPGPPTGPFSDHVYITTGLKTPAGTVALTVAWTLDPACALTAQAPQIGFSFSTRAADLTSALTHLDGFLKRGGLTLPDELGPITG